MHGRQKRHAQSTEQWKGKPVDVRVDHVEVGCPFRNCLQQDGGGRVGINTLSAEAERPWPNGVQFAAGFGSHRLRRESRRDLGPQARRPTKQLPVPYHRIVSGGRFLPKVLVVQYAST